MCPPILSLLAGALLSKSSSPTAVKTSPAPTAVDVTSGSDALDASKGSKKKAALAQGYQSTITTGSTGDQSTATTNKKTLLGG